MVLLVAKTPKKFFGLTGFGFINFDIQANVFRMMFNRFVNMFWIAEGFGGMRAPFKLWTVNSFCLICNF